MPPTSPGPNPDPPVRGDDSRQPGLLAKVVDRFVPEEHPTAPPAERVQARLLIEAIFVMVPFGLCFSVIHAGSAEPLGGPVLLMTSCVLGAVPFLLRSGLRVGPAVHLVIALYILATGTMSWLRGGFVADSLLWQVLAPLLVVLLRGPRSALVWAGIVAVELTVLFLADTLGWVAAPEGPHASWFRTAAPIVNLVSVLFLVALLARIHHRAQARAEREREAVVRRLARTERMASLGTLAATVAHEINNPIAYVSANLGYVREVLKRGLDPEDAKAADNLDEALAESLEGTDRVARIVKRLTRFVRTEDAHEPIEIDRSIETAIRITQQEVRHAASLDVRLESGAKVRGSNDELVQVFVNLLVNAAQALEGHDAADNSVTIRSHEPGEGFVLVEVRDTGPGIPEDLRSRIFDPFFTTKSASEGTGLGLAVSEAIVRQMGGRLTASDAEGGGALFRVELPVDAEPAVEAAVAPRPSEPPGRTLRILIVDDEPGVRSALSRVLRGHEISVATGGAEALQLLEEPFDLVLCDVMMPGMSGIQLFERVRARDPELAGRFVFMTGGAFRAREKKSLDATGTPTLEKPLDLTLLRRILRQR